MQGEAQGVGAHHSLSIALAARNLTLPSPCPTSQVMLCKEKHKGVGHALCKKAEELGANPLVSPPPPARPSLGCGG